MLDLSRPKWDQMIPLVDAACPAAELIDTKMNSHYDQ